MRLNAAPPQVVFRFALAVGMLPLTGTTDTEHMKQDLASRELALAADEVQVIESLAGRVISSPTLSRPGTRTRQEDHPC